MYTVFGGFFYKSFDGFKVPFWASRLPKGIEGCIQGHASLQSYDLVPHPPHPFPLYQSVMRPPRSPSKLHEHWKKNRIKIILDQKRLLPVSRKIQTKEPPAIVFFCSVGTLIQSGYIESSVTTQKVFCCLKGSEYFKKKVKKLRKCWGI
jgi:hypothetical protein